VLLDAVESFFKLGDERSLSRRETVATHHAPEIITIRTQMPVVHRPPKHSFITGPCCRSTCTSDYLRYLRQRRVEIASSEKLHLMVRVIHIAGSLLCCVAAVASAQSGYQIVQVSQGGTISGTVKWSGPLPHAAVFPIDKDAQICDPDSHKTRDLERLIVGPENGVANTVVFIKNISRGKAMEIPEARRSLDQKRCRYEPHILLVSQNGTLQLKSSDAVLHTVHMDGAATYNLPFPFTNQTVTRTMPSAGLVNVRCNGGHTWMNAELLVVPHPYYAVTDESGNFELQDVPPGRYEIVAWHEGWQLTRQEAVFDVLTERKVRRPIFSDPKIWEKQVMVNPDETATVNFVLEK
jgi:hypothetical protein